MTLLLVLPTGGAAHLPATELSAQAVEPVLLQGRVRDADSQTVIASGGVAIRKAMTGEPAGETLVIDGYFTAELSPGTYVLEIWSSGFQRVTSGPVAVRPGMDGLEFALIRVSELEGQVLDERGNGISGATIDALLDGGDDLTTVLSDGDGYFRLPALHDHAVYVLQASHPHFTTSQPIEVWFPRNGRLKIVLESLRNLPTGSLEGLVTAPGGQPLPGVRVQLNNGVPGLTGPSSETGPDGRFRFSDIEPGSYAVRFSHAGFSEQAGEQARVEINGGDTTRLDFRFSGTESLRGLVIDEAGDPVEGVQVTLLGVAGERGGSDGEKAAQRSRFYSSNSAEDGGFDFAGVPAGSYELILRSPVGIYQERRIPVQLPDDNEILLELQRGLTLQVTVTDQAGEAIENYDLSLQESSGSGGIQSRRVESSDPVTMRGLRSVEYEMTVSLPDGSQYAALIDVAGTAAVVARVNPGQTRLSIDSSSR